MALNPLLTRRAVVQAAIEATSGTAQAVGDNDGLLVMEPTFTVDAKMLDRKIVRDTLSQTAHITGRMLAKMEFSTELRGNGKQQSGHAGDAPVIARLFEACGYVMTASAVPTTLGVYDIGSQENEVSWAVNSAAADNTDMISYTIEVTTAGPSATAHITVTSDTAGEGSASAVITTATPVDLGTKGLIITPTFTGNLVVGQVWTIWLLPAGLLLSPISDNFQSDTLVMHKDGVEHTMPGSFGTFTIDAQAGEFATVKWTFTGLYNPPVDDANPSLDYETTLPSQVELARLQLNSFHAIVDKLTFDQKNDVQVRPDVSSAQGYIGTRIVSRSPEGGIDPEATLVADNDFWTDLENATRMPFQMRVGYEPGNTVWFLAPGAQYSGLTYADRQGILTYDAKLTFPCYTGDDETFFFFM